MIDSSIKGTTLPTTTIDIECGRLQLFAKANEDDTLLELLIGAGADLRRLLHGEQGFRYHCPTYAGRRVTMTAVTATS